MQNRMQPLPWRAKGLSDSIDGSTAFNGAMSALQNLIPDPTTASLWQCRPAATQIAVFGTQTGGAFSSGFSSGFMVPTVTPTQSAVSCFKIVGNLLYGMIGNPTDGFDHPFAFNLLTNTFITVTGSMTGTLPQSQPISGDWTPPIMDLIGSKMVVTHRGFSATSFFIGWFDLTNPLAPVWNAGNITGGSGIPFTQPPIAVAQFFNRAYYLVNYPNQPVAIWSDILNPLSATGVGGTITPVLSFGDNAPLTAFGQLRLYNQLGGIIQALIVFKGTANIYQITGDAALSPPTLAVNAMNFATGTMAPNSICSTPRGLAFVAPDGLRIIDFSANISDPIGYDGQGVSAPFIYSNVPSRIAAACNGNIIRVSTQNQLQVANSFQEYWYDLERKIWSGPHTFPASLIQPYANTFIMSAVDISTGSIIKSVLWQSDTVQKSSSSYVENGTQMTWSYGTAFLPDIDQLGNIHVSQATLDCTLSSIVAPLVVTCQDQNGSTVDTVTLAGSGGAAVWGNFNWGQATWGVSANALAPRKLPWHFPLVFARAKFIVTGQSTAAIRLGAWHFRYKPLKYLTDISAAA